MGAAASSSSSSAHPPRKYDVFISFRGEDTRTTFTSHLHTALCQKGIRTYIDYELPKGDDISQSLIQAIQDSSVSVVIFSENYASSKWCLNELTKILQFRKEHGQLVIPVFYKVDPSHVRNQMGSYEEAFTTHERDFMHIQEKVNQWKNALVETANLAGWDSRTYRYESKLIRDIVNKILQELNNKYPSAFKGLVGIDENCDCIELLLEKFTTIGIWGMGGIGKTTMARAVFAKLSSQFESCCFLENLREEAEKHGLTYIRDKLLLELLKEENLHNSTPKVVGSAFSMRRLGCKKVFIVLDDVNSSNQLEYLGRDCVCLGPGSKVIITTRDRQLLNGRVDKIYEAKPLSYHKSLELFNLKALHTYHPELGYEYLSKRAVDYAKGIPLALIVLGSFLRSKTTKEWDNALTKLKKTPNKHIQEVLKLSYDGLNDEEKEIFLDIACFLKGEDEEHVITLLENYGFHASIGLRTLVDNGLVTINGTVWMHDLIQKMGCEVVRQECIKEPGRRSRLCDSKEVDHVLKNNTGTDAIEGIILDLSQIGDIHLSNDTFRKMTNLRFLKFYSPMHRRSCNVSLPFGLESLSDRLRYLRWDGYPLESLPSTFCPEKLVELCMRDSHVKKLWDGVQDFGNLRRIDLGGSKQLVELPDFSKARYLEMVDLSSCESLCYVHPSILSLQRLVYLDLHKCIKLKKLQSESHLKSLKVLILDKCFSLKEFSLSSEEIARLYLNNTGIEILGSSIGRLGKLMQLCLDGSKLRNLPINELCCLRSLVALQLSNCGDIIDKSRLHMLFDALQSLNIINLDGCRNLTEVPENIKHLSRLQFLFLRNCRRLKSLPELPPSIQVLDATNCTSLETLILTSQIEFPLLPEERIQSSTPHSSTGYLVNLSELRLNVSSLKNFSIKQLCYVRSLKRLALFDCGQVIDKSKLHMLFDALCSLVYLYLEGCSNLNELPVNISTLSSLCILELEGSSVEHLPTSITHLPKLERISLANCRRLRSLPELPLSTRYVEATNCSSLEVAFLVTTPRPRQKYMVDSLFLQNCSKLEEHALSCIEKYAYLSLKRAAYINISSDVCYPGSRPPGWFKYNQTVEASSFITIELSSALNNLLGFVFCSVLPQSISKQNCGSYLKCQAYFEDGLQLESRSGNMIIKELNSHHVFLWYDPVYSARMPREEDDQGTNGDTKLSFEFSVVTCNENNEKTKHDGLIEACGVCPIYASEYHNFLQQMELGLELGTKRKTRHDTEEHSICGILEYASFSLKRSIYGNFESRIVSDPEITIPEWFTHRSSTTETSISVYVVPDFDDLLGFIFCFVIPQFSSKEKHQSHSRCRYRCRYSDNSELDRGGPRGWHYSMIELNSDNVFLWYDPLYCEFILEELRRKRGNYNPELLFEFEFGDCLIKECGVRPIYASEYSNFLQQKEPKLEPGMKTKRRRDSCAEEEQLTPTKKLKECSTAQPVPLGLEFEFITGSKTVNIDELLLTLSELNLESRNESTQQK